MNEILNYTSHGNDLFCDVGYCDCPNESFVGTDIAHYMKKRIKFTGYNDDYFFNVVNAKPTKFSCKCGKEFFFQWKREGVEICHIPKSNDG